MKTYAEQIADLEATREAKAKRMKEVVQKSIDEGRSTDTAESEEFDNIEQEIKSLDADIKRLGVLAKMDAATAKAVKPDNTNEDAARVMSSVQVKNTQKLDPGVAFARAAKCLALGSLEHRNATDIAKAMYGDHAGVVAATEALVTKAAVPAATTTDPTWAAPLVQVGGVYADFIEFLRPQSIIGRFGAGGVPSLRRVPFRTPLVGQTSGGEGYWTGEGQAKPLTQFDLDSTIIEPLKIANIAVATMELIRDSSPSADVMIRDQLAAAITSRLDTDFINPAKAAVSGVSPASILNGVAAIPSTGTDAEAVRNDIRLLFNAFIAANNAPTSGVFIMAATNALALSLMQNPLGQSEFPGLTMNGGNFMGLPVIVSQYVPAGTVALVNANDIYLADEGGIELAMSTEASLQMDNAPDNPTTATTVLVSLWQRNLVGFRAERTINWARRRPSAVAYLSGVAWGTPAVDPGG